MNLNFGHRELIPSTVFGQITEPRSSALCSISYHTSRNLYRSPALYKSFTCDDGTFVTQKELAVFEPSLGGSLQRRVHESGRMFLRRKSVEPAPSFETAGICRAGKKQTMP
jgi:hypothetical protein